MAQSDPSNPRPKFRIENLSETARKKILGITVFILMLVVLTTWIISLQSTFNQIKSTPSKKIFEPAEVLELKESLGNIIEQTKKNSEEIQNQLDALNNLVDATSTPTSTLETTVTSTATSTLELNQEDIKKLKEKILEQQLD